MRMQRRLAAPPSPLPLPPPQAVRRCRRARRLPQRPAGQGPRRVRQGGRHCRRLRRLRRQQRAQRLARRAQHGATRGGRPRRQARRAIWAPQTAVHEVTTGAGRSWAACPAGWKAPQRSRQHACLSRQHACAYWPVHLSVNRPTTASLSPPSTLYITGGNRAAVLQPAQAGYGEDDSCGGKLIMQGQEAVLFR